VVGVGVGVGVGVVAGGDSEGCCRWLWRSVMRSTASSRY
jgi:hypothetical protein